ncbi:MAG TPA: ABC transporter permease, partial [Chitinophagales bacterium]|nr:ABC transporter permease [Chitinophagales bacterium]
VMGAKIAENNNLSVGSKFVGNHGLGEEATAHYNHPYTIVGTLEPTGSAIDYLFICDINSVDIIHQSDRGNGDKEITAALIELNDPTALHNLPQSINKHTTLLAAIPTEEINKLSYISGLGTTLLEGIAWSIVFLSAMSIFITVYRSVRSRRYEMSIMRMMGATRFTLIIIILLETWLTTAAGYLLGLAVSRIGIWILQNKIIHQATLTIGYQLTPTEKYLFPVLIVFSTISVVLPMIYAFRLDISKILAEE